MLDKTAPKTGSKKRRKKRRDNHISFRATDDEFDVIQRRMALTGESQSDAVRAIIRESENQAGNVYLAPKTPPDHLETLLGELSKWRKAVLAVKSRMNIATPAADNDRHAEVVKWRSETARLLDEIPALEITVNAALVALTTMTPAKVARWKDEIPTLIRWRDGFRKKGEGAETDAALIQDLLDIIEAAGITPEK